ncbi:lasso peptide isopeptide bond-forming cyclase [Saccharothrix stipae]
MSAPTGTPGHGEVGFAVLPDCDGALAVAPFRSPADRIVTHASGRPWLVARRPGGEITAAEAGRTRLAVIGCCPVTAAELTREAARVRDVTDLDRLARRLPGSFHLVASVDGRLRVQGAASGMRLVFHAVVAGVTVVADRADLLAALAGAELDERQVAVRLLFPVPHPLGDTPMWRGVRSVAPDHYLVVEPDGLRTRESRWWSPPEPSRSLAEGAASAGEALAEAVDARTRRGGVVSCDLSGGLDSTSVCFLAARGNARVIAFTWPGLDEADDDLVWARRAAAHLPGVAHVTQPADQSPLVYAGLRDVDDVVDEPTIGVVDRARLLARLPRLASAGARLHLTGIGGDHVAWCSDAYHHTSMRTRPLFTFRRLRGYRSWWHSTWRDIARALVDNRSYGAWLAGCADGLRSPMADAAAVGLGWGTPPRVFPWVTEKAVGLAREALLAAAPRARPLGPARGPHADVEQIRGSNRVIRHWEQISARAGLPITSPFMDDRVIEAFLSVRPEDRVTPWTYKPVLKAAMRGVVPDECLARTSKAQAELDAAEGLREHRGDLLALWEDSRLAASGLVDADRLKALAVRPDTPDLRRATLYPTIGCEVWLRVLARSTTSA